ncbi:response regulator transcription factor [Chryseobacterium sp. CBo1]|uniref:response regulator transcription factor n=1 Tax=Chryseobacterium sp. CBo1 TaxID=1869230 RepID=UPI0009F4AE7A|nr:response regulator [Chryseobacterium sp. CBo1]
MKTVFILEDEAGIREVLEILLESENYLVSTFADIKEFNSRNLTIVPDVFILDVMLPDGVGTDVCNQIKNNVRTSDIPVIMMSAHAKALEMEKTCNPNAFISKPFDLSEILTKVKNLTSEAKLGLVI